MSSILTARNHGMKSRPAVARGIEGVRGETLTPPRFLDKSIKTTASQNFGESQNNRSCSLDSTHINRHDQSSAQVRLQNKEHIHY